MNLDEKVCIHFIEEDADKIFSRQLTNYVPRVGDEVRFFADGYVTFFKLTRVVWVYDELESIYQRVNIGMIRDLK